MARPPVAARPASTMTMKTLSPSTWMAAAQASVGIAAAVVATLAAADDARVTLPAPRLAYTSALPMASATADPADPALIPWAQSNALVGALRGHAGHLRGRAGDPVPPAGATPSAAPVPAAVAPGGHRHGAPEAGR